MPQYATEGFVSLIGGCNQGVEPPLLNDTQFAFGLNVSMRKGFVRTRPVFKKLKTLGTLGYFNGAGMYRLSSGDRVVFAIDGDVGVYNLAADTLTTGVASLVNKDKFYFGQADRYLIVQNGFDRPAILDRDALLRYAIPYQAYDPADLTSKNEVFTGTITKYGHGRLFVVATYVHNNDGQPDTTKDGRPYFVAGDIIKPSDPEEVLNFSETTYLNEGGAAGMPSEYGFIYGMEFFRNVQSGTGLGPFIVFAENGVSAFSVNSARTSWKDTDFSQVLFGGVGTKSNRAILPVNDDLLFRSQDGIRSIRYTASEIAGAAGILSSTPISNEVSDILDLDVDADLPFVSAASADNRVYFTSAGRVGYAFKAVVSLDTAAAFGISSAVTPPAYNGIWTGLNFLQILQGKVSGKLTLLALAEKGGDLELWYLDDSGYQDGDDNAPLCRVYDRAYNFDSPSRTKRFANIELWIRDLQGDATITAYYRPDGYALWNRCTSVTLRGAAAGQNQHRFRLTLVPLTDDVYDPTSGRNVLLGSTFQFCLEWVGNLAIEKAVYNAIFETEEPGVCCEAETAVVPLIEGAGGILLDDFTYVIV